MYLIHVEKLLSTFLWHMYSTSLGFCLINLFFRTVKTILWKSDNPVVIVFVTRKLFGTFAINKSMHVGFSVFLKYVGKIMLRDKVIYA